MRRLVCLGLATFALTSALAAQTLTLAQAEALAVKNHPQIQGSEAGYLRADQITLQVKSAYYPTIAGEVSGAQANQNARLGTGLLNVSSLFSHFGSGIAVNQLVTDSGRTRNLVANAKLSAQASREDSRATRYNVIVGVDQAYYEVLLAQQLVKVAEETVKTRQTVVDQISELARNKLKSNLDLSFVQVNLAEGQLMAIRANDQLTEAYANLSQAMGLQEARPYSLAEPESKTEGPPSDPEALLQQAFNNRPELASLRLQTQADQKFVYAERDLNRPTVSVAAVAGVLPYIDQRSANADTPNKYESAGLNVEIPIFNGRLFSARRQAAEYQLQETQQRARDLQNRIARDVRAALAKATTSYQAIATSERLLQQAKMGIDLAQGRYDLGLSSIVELTQAQLALTQAQVENVDAKYQYQEAYAVLQYTLGLVR